MAGKDSIFRISGTGKGFGTGFVIWQKGNLSYLLTCAHVVEDAGGEGNMKAGGCEAQRVACGSRNGADLAILQVEGLNAPPLMLRDAGKKDMAFSVAGFTEFDRKQGQFVFRPLRGVLGNQIFFESDQGGTVAICIKLRCRTIFQIVLNRLRAAQFEKLCYSRMPARS
jgi:hypothetical protein